GGTLSALRIDPTNKTTAHVEIDWIRLTPLQLAARGPLELLETPTARPARVEIALADTRPQVGVEQIVTVRVVDAGGRPTTRQPVKLALTSGSGGAIEAAPGFPSLAIHAVGCRALTGAGGTALFGYRASRRAGVGADTLEAVAEFSGAAPGRL